MKKSSIDKIIIMLFMLVTLIGSILGSIAIYQMFIIMILCNIALAIYDIRDKTK